MLIDDIDGNPKEFYQLVKEEVSKRQIPGVNFEDRVEFRPKGLLSADKFPSLSINDGTSEIRLFAYQFARSFYVSSRGFWKDQKLGAKADEDPASNYGLVAQWNCFTESVNRAVSSALSRYLEKK